MMDFIGFFVVLFVLVATVAYWWGGHTKSISDSKRKEGKAVTAEGKEDISHSSAHAQSRNNNKDKNVPKRNQQQSSKSSTSAKPTDQRFLRRFGGHTGAIESMAVSPDGEWIATAGIDGLIRVSKINTQNESNNTNLYLQTKVKNPELGFLKDYASILSWLPDGRTIVCTIHKSRDIAFYRIRRKKEPEDQSKQSSASVFPYELIELSKRRFHTSLDRGIDFKACLADLSHPNSCLLFTNSTTTTELHTTVAWDGMKGEALGNFLTRGGGVRLSPDGRFLCARSLGGPPLATELKIYEVQRNKVKGQVEPVFDKISSKSVMTVIAKGSRMRDVTFCATTTAEGPITNSLMCLGCDDGSIQIWDIDVEYKRREDPKILCIATSVLPSRNNKNAKIVRVAASVVGCVQRIAVAMSDSSLHLLIYSPPSSTKPATILLEFSIEGTTHPEGISDLQFCPASANVLYSRGNESRDVFAWTIN